MSGGGAAAERRNFDAVRQQGGGPRQLGWATTCVPDMQCGPLASTPLVGCRQLSVGDGWTLLRS
jgi:hypothetical protein